MEQLVSIIMPAYNAARYIAESIASVQAQTHKKWELLVVDDGSTDSTAAIVQQYCKQDSRVKYIHQQNARQGRARNNGLAHAKGEYIAFLDADDLWLPQKLAVQLQDLIASKADLVFCDAYVFSELLEVTPTTPLLRIQPGAYEGNEGLHQFLIRNRIPILTALCSRATLMKTGGFTEDKLIQNAEDYHLWLHMLVQGCVIRGYSYVLAAYRVHAASVSDSNNRLNLKQAIEARAAISRQYPAVKIIVKASLAQPIKQSIGELAFAPEGVFFAALNRYLELTNRSQYSLGFYCLRAMNRQKLAVRAAYFILNYL